MVVVLTGVVLHQHPTGRSNGHNGIEVMLHMVLVVHQVRTMNVEVMVVKASSSSTNLFNINNKEGDN
jgi:hypothetical protein